MSDLNNSQIRNAQDALLWLDCLARFGQGDTIPHFAAIAKVIRELMHRIESQALAMEREEANREQKA